jgi:uncharacterized protein (DUF1810 family)
MPNPPNDSHDLQRFVDAQAGVYDRALAELRAGRKESHWMWFIFPQFAGLGRSTMSERFAIRSLAEAEAYLKHPVLSPRLMECAEALLAVRGRSAHEILGSPDDAKLQSCATLFSRIAPDGSVLHRLLDRFFEGVPDQRTLELLAGARTGAGGDARAGTHARPSGW